MRRRKVPYNHKLMRLFAIVLALGSLMFCAAVIGAVALYQHAKSAGNWPHVTNLQTERIGQNSAVYAGDGSRIGIIASPENRRALVFSQLGKNLPDALVSVEDRRFWQHDGVDAHGIARAMWVNIKARSFVQGASTIDQQLVRNLYPEISTDKTLTRKMKEASLAQELNQVWGKKYGKRQTKERIITLYLNLVYFGNNAYGADAASHTYFDKPALALNIQEAAMIAGIVQNPAADDPFRHPQATLARRQEVIAAMRKAGVISSDQAKVAHDAPLGLKPGRDFRASTSPAPYFFDYVRQQAEKAYGKDTVSRGGLRIYTTLNPKMQKLALQSIRKILNRPGDPASAMVVIENSSGAIKAMASSTRYTHTQFNFAAQARRQPGSSAKIWALSALLQEGVNPDQIRYLSTALKVRPGPGQAIWNPHTYEGTYSGLQNVRKATVASDNTVFAQITMDVTPQRVADTAMKMGIQSNLKPEVTIGLGSQEVTPLEQTSFYSTIARGGVRVDPWAVSEVKSISGRTSETKRPSAGRVMYKWQASEIISILKDNVDHGTGTAAQLPGIEVSGKTGTTDSYKDAWFCGMTPAYTACVWVGYPRPRPMTNVHGIKVAGGTLPAQIWADFMIHTLKNNKGRSFPHEAMPHLKDYVPSWCNRPGIQVIEGPRNIRCSSTREDGLDPVRNVIAQSY